MISKWSDNIKNQEKQVFLYIVFLKIYTFILLY